MTFTVPEATRVDLDLDGRRAARPWSRGPGRGAGRVHALSGRRDPLVRRRLGAGRPSGGHVASQRLLQGDHRGDWPATECPALLVHGVRSDTLSSGHAQAI
ncbi:hypothetical protein [Streptomyces cyaneofuscatus]|uniref:hypothetical protein n=1 Tax=Streptomyces cyaneofuscatus TaxID=66883 RepID=UPI00344159D4